MIRNSLVLAAIVSLGPCSKAEDAKPAASASASASAVPVASASASAAPPEKPFDQLVKESKPLAITTAEQPLGTSKLTAEVCTVEGGPVVGKSTMGIYKSIRAIGEKVFVVDADEQVRAFKIEAGPTCKLSVDKTFGTDGVVKLENKVDRVVADSAGNLWATSGIWGAWKLDKAGKVAMKCSGRPQGSLFVHPSGKWAIGTFANATVSKVTIDAGTCKNEPWAFQDLGQDDKRKGVLTNAQAVGFVGDTIFMGGSLDKKVEPNGSIVVLALDKDGKEKARLGKTDKDYSTKDRFGWVHAIGPCKLGVCVLDSNYRRLTAWKADGKFLGDVSLSSLFGLKYPWIADFDRNTKHAYFVTGQDREGGKVSEGNIFRVTGL